MNSDGTTHVRQPMAQGDGGLCIVQIRADGNHSRHAIPGTTGKNAGKLRCQPRISEMAVCIDYGNLLSANQ